MVYKASCGRPGGQNDWVALSDAQPRQPDIEEYDLTDYVGTVHNIYIYIYIYINIYIYIYLYV